MRGCNWCHCQDKRGRLRWKGGPILALRLGLQLSLSFGLELGLRLGLWLGLVLGRGWCCWRVCHARVQTRERSGVDASTVLPQAAARVSHHAAQSRDNHLSASVLCALCSLPSHSPSLPCAAYGRRVPVELGRVAATAGLWLRERVGVDGARSLDAGDGR